MGAPTDLATLGLRLDNTQTIADAQRTGQAFDDMGARGMAASRNITLSANPMEQAILRQASAANQAAGGFLTMEQALEAETAAARMALSATDASAVSHVAAAEAVTEHSLSIGRLSRNLEGFAVRALGANEQVGLIAASFGHAELGGLGLIGVLGGIAAAIFIWRAWTEETRKADEAMAALVKTSDDLKKSQSETHFGPGPSALAAAQVELDDLNERIANQVKRIPANDQTVYGEFQIGQLIKLQDQRDKLTASMLVFRSATDEAAAAEKRRRDAEENGLAVAAQAVVQLREHASAIDRSAVNLAILSANQKADTEILKNSLETRRTVREQMDQTTEAMRRATIASITADEQFRQQNNLRSIAFSGEQTLMGIRQQASESIVTETFALRALVIEHQHERDILAAGEGKTQNEVVARMRVADAIQAEALALNSLNKTQSDAERRMTDRFRDFFFPMSSGAGDNFAGLDDWNKKINEKAKAFVGDLRQDFSSLFDDILHKGLGAFQQIFDSVRGMVTKLIADITAKKLAEGLAGFIGTAATKTTAETGAGGSILGGLGAAATAHPLIAGALGIAIVGSLLGGLFDHKKHIDENTTALKALTASITNAPAGFKVDAYRFAAASTYSTNPYTTPQYPTSSEGITHIVIQGDLTVAANDPIQLVRKVGSAARDATARGGSTGLALSGS